MTIYKFEEKPKEVEVLYYPLQGKFTTEYYSATLHYDIGANNAYLSLAPRTIEDPHGQTLSASDLDELIEFLQSISAKLKGENHE